MSANVEFHARHAAPSISNVLPTAIALLAGAVLIALVVAISAGGGPQAADLVDIALP